jgi:hypothetical protein
MFHLATWRFGVLALILSLCFANVGYSQLNFTNVPDETVLRLSGQPVASVKLTNGAYRNGKFIYASKYYVVIDTDKALSKENEMIYGGLPVEWSKIDTFRINELDVVIDVESVSGDEIITALSSLSGAMGSPQKPTALYRTAYKNDRKKPQAGDAEVNPAAALVKPEVGGKEEMGTPNAGNTDAGELKRPKFPGGQKSEFSRVVVPSKPASDSEVPMEPGVAEAPTEPSEAGGAPMPASPQTEEPVFICSGCKKDVRPSQMKYGRCPHCGIVLTNAPSVARPVATATPAGPSNSGNPVAPMETTPAPAPANVQATGTPGGPVVLTIPQTPVAAQEQAQGFSFSNLGMAGQIGMFVGILAALYIVIRVL